ncbi:hypothetical protein BCV70DRAFT_201562 [Testicularia cyperi]|uniref:Inhibitor-sensitive equilibrative nucleoside transporter 1 n=1 Tax=Testicularia cyperi TaxID=1882483 RepID=A0A317XKD6_9BASI|nr:hypothetical protein BCV70DRAFT_201562 [Testicularia cyperi]
MRQYRDADEDEALLSTARRSASSPLLPHHNSHHHADDDDGPAEPPIRTGVEGAPAWSHMSRAQHTLVYVTFGLLGMGVLLPFNSLITPAEYFRASFAHTSYANTFSSWIVVSYNVVSILVGIHSTATGGFERSSPRRRIITSSAAIIVAVLCFAISTTLGGDSFTSPSPDSTSIRKTPASNSYFYFTLLLGAILSSACAYLQNSVVSLSTAFGGNGAFMGCMLAGQGLVGVGISIFGLISAWSQSEIHHPGSSAARGSSEPADSIARAATLFFGMNSLLMGLVLAVFIWLANTTLYAQVMAKQVATIDKIQDDELDQDADQDRSEDDAEAEQPMVQSWHSVRSVSHPAYHSALKRVPGFHRLAPSTRESLLRLALVQDKVKWDCFAIAFVFIVTLSLFPALTSSVQSVYTDASRHRTGNGALDLTSPQLFVPFHFLFFNASDLLGRTLPSLSPRAMIRKARALVSLSLARVVFVPLLMACNVVSTSQRTGPITNLPSAPGQSGGAPQDSGGFGWLASILQSSDAPFFALMLLLGLSNGLTSTCIMIAGPTRSKLINSKGASEGPLAATLLSFWLCVGLAIGSGLSFLTV